MSERGTPLTDATHFQYEVESGFGDEVQIAVTDRGMHIEICEPLAGDTETGFGATCSLTLPRHIAIALHEWLGAALSQKD